MTKITKSVVDFSGLPRFLGKSTVVSTVACTVASVTYSFSMTESLGGSCSTNIARDWIHFLSCSNHNQFVLIQFIDLIKASQIEIKKLRIAAIPSISKVLYYIFIIKAEIHLVLHNDKICLESINVGSFQLVKGKNVPFSNFSLVSNHSPLKLSKNLCFSQCLRNEFCSFVVYSNKTCSLHTEYALNHLITNSDLKILFEKKFIKDHCVSCPCLNGATCVNKLDEYICLCIDGFFGKNCEKNINSYACSTGYYRLNENDSCKPCMSGFTTFNNYPFNCYKTNDDRIYQSGKLLCQSLNAYLWRPKTMSERKIYIQDPAWIDSIISYVGEPFVWPDGSKEYALLVSESWFRDLASSEFAHIK
ncbi:neurocan core -like [Brachionus plicatilis]|uniref:Neurocan core-like n=1 Tax=Brachionus plicatilis TaxID=10195 RepID=A0A3M7SBS1_BRAPC|nr:neurocan core -like [Brachionus plicatilis]